MAVIRDDAVLFEEIDKVGQSVGFVITILAPDGDDRRIIGMSCPVVRFDCFVIAERAAIWVRPIGRAHPTIVAIHDRAVRAIIGRELHDHAAGHPLREFEDVPDGRAAEAIETLVFVPDNAEISTLLRESQEELLLDVVGVLILIHQHVT